jgi:hypothetical protein
MLGLYSGSGGFKGLPPMQGSSKRTGTMSKTARFWNGFYAAQFKLAGPQLPLRAAGLKRPTAHGLEVELATHIALRWKAEHAHRRLFDCPRVRQVTQITKVVGGF